VTTDPRATPDDPVGELADRLRQLRRRSGRSLKDLESLTHASDSSLSRYLSGRAVPPWPVVVALCQAVGRDPRRLRGLWRRAEAAGTRRVPPAGTPRPAAGSPGQAAGTPGPAAGAPGQAGGTGQRTGAAARPAGRNGLPRDVTGFAGRSRELGLVLGAPANAVTVIDGMAGVGKTALAVHAAHRLAAAYPDGQLYLDLHGFTPGRSPVEPATALRRLLTLREVPEQRIPAEPEDAAALWRAELADARALLVLDNAADAAQVAPLLPGTAATRVLVTSRNRLVQLDDAVPVSLDVLPTDSAVSLFAAIVGTDRAGAEPAAVADVLRLCGGLPLAIRIAAARLRHRPAWSVASLAARLRDEHRRLAELAAGERDVAAAFAVSLRQLTGPRQRAFRLLGLVPGNDFDAPVVAALTGLAPAEAADVLEELVDANLVQQPDADRYALHDLLRAHARNSVEAGESAAERDAAVRRVLDYYLAAAYRGQQAIATRPRPLPLPPDPPPVPEFADRRAAVAWFDREHPNLVAAFDRAAQLGATDVVRLLPQAMDSYLRNSSHAASWIRLLRTALAGTDDDADPATGVRLRLSLMIALHRAGDPLGALAEDDDTRTLAARAGDPELLATVLMDASGPIQAEFGRFDAAVDQHRRAAELWRQLGDEARTADATVRAASAMIPLGRHTEARGLLDGAAGTLRGLGYPVGIAVLTRVSGLAALAAGDADRALASFRECLAVSETIDHAHGILFSHTGIAVAHRLAGRLEEALDHHRTGADLVDRSGIPEWGLNVLNPYGTTCLAAGLPVEARRYHRQALDLAIGTHARYHEALSLLGLGAAEPDPGLAADGERILTALHAVPVPLA
jgi:tetratricopeptide (TPR) repeat protein